MAPAASEPTPDVANVPSDESIGSDINIGYEVVLARDDLISIEFTVSSYLRARPIRIPLRQL